jgi:exodeoxyribonuclease VII small subunit
MSAELSPRPTYAEWESVLEHGSFEEVYEALAAVVSHLEDARLPLADSLACYELGMRLAGRCERYLNEAELRISRLDEIGVSAMIAEDETDDDAVPF